jgi:hypothetical protein
MFTFVFEDGFIKKLCGGAYVWLFRSDAVTLLQYDTLLNETERESLRQIIAQYDAAEKEMA